MHIDAYGRYLTVFLPRATHKSQSLPTLYLMFEKLYVLPCAPHSTATLHMTTLHFTTVLCTDLECCKRPKHLKSLEKQLAFFRDPTQPETSVSFQTNTEQRNSVTFTAHTNDCWGPMPISVLRLHLRQCNLHRHAETSGRCPGYMAAVWLLLYGSTATVAMPHTPANGG